MKSRRFGQSSLSARPFSFQTQKGAFPLGAQPRISHEDQVFGERRGEQEEEGMGE